MDTFSKIAAYLGGSCSQAEKQAIESWIKENPANEKEFYKLKKLWEFSGDHLGFRPDTEGAWQKVNNRLFEKKEKKPAKHFLLAAFIRQPWPLAAAFVLLLLTAALFFFPAQKQGSIPYADLNSLQTTKGNKQEMQLADGSRVWLNENTTFYYPDRFQDSSRQVYLEGEAYFEVAHQADKPFIVHSGEGKVEVLGTSFSILQQEEKLKVYLLEGKVKFSSKEKSLLLTAGQAAVWDGRELKKATPEPNGLSWKTGNFHFENTRLEEVFRALEGYYPVRFQAGNTGILDCRIFADFKQEPLPEVLKVLSLTLNLEIKKAQEADSDLYIATGKGCDPIK